MVKIEKVEFGEITVDGKTYYSDVIVFWTGKVILVEKTHVIDADFIGKFLLEDLDELIIGTGIEGTIRIREEVLNIMEDKGVKLYSDVSGNAAEIFNGAVAKGKKAVVFIHTNT